MKKLLIIVLIIPFFITILGYFIANSSPDYSEDRHPIDDEAVRQSLISVVQNYRQDMADAIGRGGFSEVEDYFVKNHTYRNVRAYMNQLDNSPNSEMELLEQTIEDVTFYYSDEVEIYCVDVFEVVRVVEKGVEEVEELLLRYELIKHGDEYKIESIVQK